MRKLLVFLITLASIAFAECSLSSAQFAGAVALEHQDLRRLKPLAAAAVYVQHSTATPTASSTASGGFGNQSGAQAPAASITVPASGFGISGFVAGCDINNWSSSTDCVISIAHTATAGAGWLATVTGSPTAIAFTGDIG